jgi:RsiW-degrading membrane proteinase PrsW (M82 family)
MTLLLTFLPGLLILFYFVYSDRFKEPKKIILITFILGIAIGYPAGHLNYYVARFFSNGNIINDALVGGAFAGAIVEEILKFLILYFYIFKQKEFNEPMDAIVYGVIISLGFAINENYDYVYRISEEANILSWDMALARSYSAIPMHAVCGVIMGFYFGQNYFIERGKSFSLALIIPIIIHGSYNFLLSFNWFYSLTILILAVIFCFYLHRVAKDHQKYKDKEHEEKLN